MNKRFLSFAASLTLLLVLIAGCGSQKNAVTPPATIELNISAAASLKAALEEIQKNYQAPNPGIKLIYNFGASGALQKQIEQGAPCDIFMSAAVKQMDDLAGKALINTATRKNLLKNQLVVVVPKTSDIHIAQYEDLAKSKVQKVGIGETATVPAGQYAQEVLTKLGLWDQIKEKAVLAKDVRTVLAYVETGNVEAGIVYKTDAAASDKVRIAATAPEGLHQPIIYSIAMLSEAKQPVVAEDFLMYLSAPECKKIFEKYGFIIYK